MKTIRGQLTRKLLLAIGALVGVGGLAVYFFTRAALESQFDAALRAKAEAITTLTENDAGELEFDFSDEHMRGFDTGGKDFFELWRADGTTLERSRSLGEDDLPMPPANPSGAVLWNVTLPGGKSARVLGLKFRPRGSDEHTATNALADVTLVVASHRGELDRTLVVIGWILAGGGLLLLGATALVVPRLLRRELTPLQQLADHAAGIDAVSLSARFPTASQPGELAPITARLNELLGRLEDSFERERRFSSDVAHEFRTPVAELRCLAELALKMPETRAANTDEEVLAITLHLERVLAHLLALSRAEKNGLPAERQSVSLGPLIDNICRTFQPKVAARELKFNWTVSPDDEITSDPVLLRCVFANLVENAVEYTPRGGSIDVEATLEAGAFTLRVINTVDNLDERDLPKLFDRFWRKDPARTPDGHTGLGLSLARSFAQALGCELTATFVDSKRLSFTLSGARTSKSNSLKEPREQNSQTRFQPLEEPNSRNFQS